VIVSYVSGNEIMKCERYYYYNYYLAVIKEQREQFLSTTASTNFLCKELASCLTYA